MEEEKISIVVKKLSRQSWGSFFTKPCRPTLKLSSNRRILSHSSINNNYCPTCTRKLVVSIFQQIPRLHLEPLTFDFFSRYTSLCSRRRRDGDLGIMPQTAEQDTMPESECPNKCKDGITAEGFICTLCHGGQASSARVGSETG